ncbi:MAG: transketolase C-terminal domain-containing protein, partial [Candidatus Methylomirabilales bacterium]
HKLLYPETGEVPEEEVLVPLGVADVKRAGEDVTVVAHSRMVHLALRAADRLAAEGISCEVVDPRTLDPLDVPAILRSVEKTSRLVILQEAVAQCSFASEVAALVAEEALDCLDAPIRRVTALDTPMPFSPKLERFVVPSEERVMAAVREVCA